MFVSQRANDLFAKALALEPNARMAFITTQCAEDGALFDEVSSLLEAASQSESYFGAMVESVSLLALADTDDSVHEGKVVGQWRLLECIGRGGMGSVYAAQRADDAFQHKVAVKLLPVGMDGDVARARFVQERQILARLSHEYIAGLLDGGVTDDGIPFFAMEFVDGQPIDLYCDAHSLSPKARMSLVLDVADALAYAHRNLVIHRDLKPNNILIDRNGRVRLLDFGIAQFMEPANETGQLTQLAQRPVTPAFASPEMLAGDPVDVTSDVYSLGVLAYVLLTAHLPVSFDGLSLAATIARARTAVPPPPSSLVPGTHPDVDAILGKALARLPNYRYASVDQFANDLRAYLAGRPVTAQEPTAWYRLSRFVRRHLWPVTLAMGSVVALAGVTAVALFQAIEAERQRDAVLLEQQRTRASNEFFGGLIDELDNTPMSSLELLDRGAALLRAQYDNEQPFMAYTLYEMARRYARLRETDKQIALLEQVVTAAAAQSDHALQSAALCRLSGVVGQRAPELADQYSAKGKQLFESLRTPSLEASVDCLRMLARDAVRSEDSVQALNYMQRAKTIAVTRNASVDILGPILGYIAHLHFNDKRMQEALDTLDETRALLVTNGRGNSLGYLQVTANKAVTLDSIGRLPESLDAWRDVVQRIRDSGYGQRGSAGVLNQYAHTLARSGQLAQSVPLYEESRQVARSSGDLRNVALADLGLARAALANDDFTTAISHLDQLQEYAATDRDADPGVTRAGDVLRIKLHRKAGQLDAAFAMLGRLQEEIGYPQAQRGAQLLSTIIEAATLHQVSGDFATAERYADDLIGRMSTRAVGPPLASIDVARAYVQRAGIREQRGNCVGAAADAAKGLTALESMLGQNHPETIEARDVRERCHGVN